MPQEKINVSHDRVDKLTKGLAGILNVIENYFHDQVTIISTNNSIKLTEYAKSLKPNCIKYEVYAKKGKAIILEIIKDMNNIQSLLSNVPFVSDGFKLASKGLKGASNITEEATIKIQDSSDSIQTDLDEVTKELKSLLDMESMSQENKKILEDSLKKITNMADTAFNIMIALQFQDILRQQLAAVNTILSQTRANISTSVERLTGMPIVKEDEIEIDVCTDASILTAEKSQHEVDEIIKNGNN